MLSLKAPNNVFVEFIVMLSPRPYPPVVLILLDRRTH